MGRWAEVYFTSPPEKRGEAVAQLLRELEGEPCPDTADNPGSVLRKEEMRAESPDERATTARNGDQGDDAPPFHSRAESREETPITASDEDQLGDTPQFSSTEDGRQFPSADNPHIFGVADFGTHEVHACPGCSYENSKDQKFCGMCGGPLDVQPEEVSHAQEESHPESDAPVQSENRWNDTVGFSGGSFLGFSTDPSRRHGFEEDAGPAWTQAEDDLPRFAVEEQSVPYRYRLYVGAALGILLAALVYMAWRGTSAFTGGAQSAPSRAIPAAPTAQPEMGPATTNNAENPASTNDSAATTANPPQAVANSRARNPDVLPTSGEPPAADSGKPPVKVASEKTAPEKSTVETRVPERPTSRRLARAERAARPKHTVAENSPVPGPGQGGAEELAMAEKYLNGNPGGGREAAPWLWKAVAKGNLAATMSLSDLYLKGNGVPQNCDQARLLLDAAARKGSAAAGLRLRNMRAFGCQ